MGLARNLRRQSSQRCGVLQSECRHLIVCATSTFLMVKQHLDAHHTPAESAEFVVSLQCVVAGVRHSGFEKYDAARGSFA